MFLAIVAIVLTLVLVVGVHEAGHALAARIAGVTIKKISIGFGRPLIRWTGKNGCEWVWAMWPLGGYVQLLNSRISPVPSEQFSECFDKKTVGVRIAILLAGSAANLVTAWLAFVLVFFVGMNYKLPLIQTVLPDSIAAKAGMLDGDQLIAINQRSTPTFREAGMYLIELWGNKKVEITVKHLNGTVKQIDVDLSQIEFGSHHKSLVQSLGFIPNMAGGNVMLRYPSLLSAMHQANVTIAELIYFFLVILKQLITGVIPFSVLLGPLGLFVSSVTSLIQGVLAFMFFIASLSMAVALVNLFPVPGIDGGSIVYTIVEKIRGEPASVGVEVLIHRLFFILFCVLLVHLTVNDLQRLFLH